MLKHLALGFAAGVVISVAPLEFNVFIVPGFLVILVLAAKRRPAGSGLMSYALAGIVALAAIVIAVPLPTKYLDRKVGPISYERMSLDDLCQALRKDHRVLVSAPYPQGTNMVLRFQTDRVMTRREVLGKLANDSGCEFRVGYCGNGVSFLFGAHPVFIDLDVKSAHVE